MTFSMMTRLQSNFPGLRPAFQFPALDSESCTLDSNKALARWGVNISITYILTLTNSILDQGLSVPGWIICHTRPWNLGHYLHLRLRFRGRKARAGRGIDQFLPIQSPHANPGFGTSSFILDSFNAAGFGTSSSILDNFNAPEKHTLETSFISPRGDGTGDWQLL